MCFNDCADQRPSDAAEVRLKIAGYYTKVARSDPSRLEVRDLNDSDQRLDCTRTCFLPHA